MGVGKAKARFRHGDPDVRTSHRYARARSHAPEVERRTAQLVPDRHRFSAKSNVTLRPDDHRFGAPVGPFQIYDIVGLTTPYNILAHGDAEAQKLAAWLKESYIDKGKLGLASGEGFYKYS